MGKVVCIKTRQEITEVKPMELHEIENEMRFIHMQLVNCGMVGAADQLAKAAALLHQEIIVDAIQAVAAVACQAKTQE